MKVLLDTHAFIWWDSDPSQLSARVRATLADPATEVWLSTADPIFAQYPVRVLW